MPGGRFFWVSALSLTLALVVAAEILRAVVAVWRAQRWERMVALAALLAAWGGGSAVLLLFWSLRRYSGAGGGGMTAALLSLALYATAGLLAGWGARRLTGRRRAKPEETSQAG